jgi:hypothetical protein
MKKRILGYVAVVVTVICLCAAPSFAADNYKIGVGYQGMFSGNMMNGLSVRGWLGPNTAIGLEGNLYYGSLKGNVSVSPYPIEADLNANLWMAEVKAMYAFLVRTNSRFYAGAKFAYGQYDASAGISGINVDLKGKMYIPGVLVGAEWNFPSLPELGFNFEVGYNYVINNNAGTFASSPSELDIDLKMHGINVGAGIKYYF